MLDSGHASADTARMSLPPGFLDELRNRLSLGQVVGRKVMWDTRKSNQGKGDLWAPCPFHQEKTPSFHVNPVRQSFHCFGCNEGGDVFTFVSLYESLSFVESLRRLAERAKTYRRRRRLPLGACSWRRKPVLSGNAA